MMLINSIFYILLRKTFYYITKIYNFSSLIIFNTLFFNKIKRNFSIIYTLLILNLIKKKLMNFIYFTLFI